MSNHITHLVRMANGTHFTYVGSLKGDSYRARRRLDEIALEKIGDLVQRGWERERAIRFVTARFQWARQSDCRPCNWPIPGFRALSYAGQQSDELPF